MSSSAQTHSLMCQLMRAAQLFQDGHVVLEAFSCTSVYSQHSRKVDQATLACKSREAGSKGL